MKTMFHSSNPRPAVLVCTFFLCLSLLSCKKEQQPFAPSQSKEESREKESSLPAAPNNSADSQAQESISPPSASPESQPAPSVLQEAPSLEDSLQSSQASDLPTEASAAKEAPVFTSEEIPDEVFERMEGCSFGPDCTVSKDELRYLRLSYYGFDNQVHTGEMVVNRKISEDVLDIFRELYEIRYPIEKIRLIDEYQGDDEAAMADNNTSCFNFRLVPGKNSLSRHSYGLAIDVNPLYNPYVRMVDDHLICSPPNGAPYQNRDQEFPYKITDSDPCYEIFTAHGFSWGGSWNYEKDYQHFSKSPD